MRNLILLLCMLAGQRLAAIPAYDFSVTDSDGNTHELYADYINQGKAVVIEFFFTTCPPCATHAPYYQTLYTQMKQQFAGNVEFFLVTTLVFDTNAKVATYKTNKGLTMPGIGTDGNSQDILEEFQSGTYGLFYATPTFVVIAPYSGEVFYDIREITPQATMDKIAILTTHLLQPPQPNALCDVLTPLGDGIANVQMHVDATNLDTSFAVDGQYNLANFPALQNNYPYNFWASRNDNYLNGVSTYDLVLIAKHILGLEPLNAA
ncbi:MAG: redoxin domain-containing protein [Lewinellaceae bacterium]|nr:redoxin domain-containing protein [Lewinellaceae bacterium]